jgi:hypothetical protein
MFIVWGKKMRTSELKGAALDWAVAKAEGIELEHGHYNRLLVDGRMSSGQSMLARYLPSTDWAQSGPIIEQEEIELTFDRASETDTLWRSEMFDMEGVSMAHEYGPTPLIAAMRCFVASKLGDEVEIPEELK